MRKLVIDSVFDRAERSGLQSGGVLKYIWHFSDREKTPIVELGNDLEEDSIEVIHIYKDNNRWRLSAFRNEAHTRASMFEKERMLRWQMFKFKVDDYDGFSIAPADIHISAVPDDQFFPFIKSLSNQDLFNVGMRLDKIKQHDKAMLVFQELIDREINTDTSYFKLGSSLVATNEYVKGIQHWEQAVEINPDFLEAHIELGKIFYENSHWRQSHEHFREADRIKPNDDVILYNLAKSLIKLERYNEAYNTIRRAVKINRRNVYAKGVLKDLRSKEMRKLRRQNPEK